MKNLGPFSARALIALHDSGPLDDRQIAQRMQLRNPTSVMAELDQLQLVTCAITDRTTRPWTWRYKLTPAGITVAKEQIQLEHLRRTTLDRDLDRADRDYQEKSRRGHYGDGHDGNGRRQADGEP